MNQLYNKFGSYALITGASSGIGKEFAIQLAQKGFNLVLVARRSLLLQNLAEKLRLEYHVDIKIINLDLLDPQAIEHLSTQTKGLDIGLLIPCAGMEVHGPFLKNKLESERNMLTLNAIVPMQLAHIYGKQMAERKKGAILLIASTFGHQSVPFFANYAAGKAYLLHLGPALNYEFKRSGVSVSVFSPGLTKTEMTENMEDMDFGKVPLFKMSTEEIVKTALRKIGKKQIIIPGTWNVIMDFMGKYLSPRAMITFLFGKIIGNALNFKI